MTEEEKKIKTREYNAKYYEKTKSDPERYAKRLENNIKYYEKKSR